MTEDQFVDLGCTTGLPACIGSTNQCVSCIVGDNPYCIGGTACVGTTGEAGTCGTCSVTTALTAGAPCSGTVYGQHLGKGACFTEGGQPGKGSCVPCAVYASSGGDVTVGCATGAPVCVQNDDVPVIAGQSGVGCRQADSSKRYTQMESYRSVWA